jgi:hypothetical protein
MVGAFLLKSWAGCAGTVTRIRLTQRQQIEYLLGIAAQRTAEFGASCHGFEP